jgi:hypothetical protein
MKRKGHIIEYVDDYLHGLLSADDAGYVQEHCQDCRICQVALEQARQRHEAMLALPTAEASEELIQSTLGRIRSAQRRRRRVRTLVLSTWALATAASVAVIGGLHLYYLGLSPTSYDLQVLGQRGLLADAEGSVRIHLFDRRLRTAVPGVPVDIELHDRSGSRVFRLASFTTDACGTGSPRFRLPDVPEGEYELRVRARTPGQDEVLTRTVRLMRSWKLMLSTDKPVYQPGQVIHIRSLGLRRPDLRPVAGQEVVFSITDPKGNVIFKERDVSSAYGIAATDCPLAGEILEGAYAVACRMGDTESKLAVEVKKYVLPKFKLDLELDRTFYQPGQTVRGTVHANYFFGKPVTDAEAQIAVAATDVGPTELVRLTARTDHSGVAEFEYRLPETLIGREQDAGDARVTFAVTLRDTAGQEQTRSVCRLVTANPIRLEVIPEAGRLVAGVANTIYVFASYPDGRPARVQLAITGVAQALATSELGIASFELTPSSSQIGLTLRATDEQGRVGRRHVNLEIGPVQRDFLVRTDKATYKGGDTVHLVALGGGVEPVFVDFVKDGQTILTETVDMTEGRGQYAFDLPPDVFGTIQITAYRFGDAGLPVRKTRVIYVQPARVLNIAAELDHSEYRPGEQARLVVQLTDDSGRPAPGAISLAAVDEAVFAVLEQVPGMERAFFNLEQELLQPIYAIYNWTPNLETSVFDPADRNRFEQALFSRTARDIRGRGPVFDRMLREGVVTERQLETLNAPELDGLIDQGALPDGLADAVRASNDPYSLAAASYPAKLRAAQQAQAHGLGRVKDAWVVFAVALAATGVAVVLILAPRAWVIVVILLLGLPCAASFFLPSLARSREVSKRAVTLANLRGIELGMTDSDISEADSLRPADKLAGEAAAQPAIRVREWFPETLLWRPELITDDAGRVSLDIDLADSITTWRLTASAVAADGRLGGLSSPIRVFQPFFVDLNLPVALTRGDEVAVPVVVYNYLDEPQTVELSLDTDAPWFELLDQPLKRVELAAGQVQSTSYQLRVRQVGRHELRVTARGSGVGDAIKHPIEVMPDGPRVARVFNGTLSQPAVIELPVPSQAIEGSAHAILKIYPSAFSQLVEGLEGILQRPYGCFEQTSSTTYPNVLALDYLRQTKQSVPEVEAKARQYIHLGYQRLVSFEVNGGGFDWFGRPPANRTLTAYGLMEFEDMAKVHDVDPRLIQRTRDWLLAQRNADGSWSPESHKMHIDPTVGGGEAARLSTTAYVAWAAFRGNTERSLGASTENYLLAHPAVSIDDPYVLALICNALLAIDADHPEVRPYLVRLLSLKEVSADNRQVWWQRPAQARTEFYGTGLSGNIETTALATLALLKSGTEPATTRGALAWLASQKDRLGTWHSTQATVLALKALLAGTGQALGGDRERVVQVVLNGARGQTIVIPADQAEVMKQVDLSEQLVPGVNRLTLAEPSGTGVGYQVDFWYHLPQGQAAEPAEALAINIDYDRTDLQVGNAVWAEATVVNNMSHAAPMVILDLPIPAGFATESDTLAALVESGAIAKYQITARSIIVYLRELAPGKPVCIRYRLEATMPVRITVPPARIYEYYDPDNQGTSQPTQMDVRTRGASKRSARTCEYGI